MIYCIGDSHIINLQPYGDGRGGGRWTPNKPNRQLPAVASSRFVLPHLSPMTIKATFPDGPTMMFGDSYRKWWDQLAEYCRTFKKPRPFVEISSAKWIGFGGVKWCSFASLQDELDEEGDGRKAESFVFRPLSLIEQRTLAKHVRSWENKSDQ